MLFVTSHNVVPDVCAVHHVLCVISFAKTNFIQDKNTTAGINFQTRLQDSCLGSLQRDERYRRKHHNSPSSVLIVFFWVKTDFLFLLFSNATLGESRRCKLIAEMNVP